MTTENTPNEIAPGTIVLVHDFWVTPLSWEKWVERYEGLTVVRTQRLSATKALNETLPDSHVVTMHGQGHVAMHTAPELFAGLVVGVLAQERATP